MSFFLKKQGVRFLWGAVFRYYTVVENMTEGQTDERLTGSVMASKIPLGKSDTREELLILNSMMI